jgi:hypothetical protein
MERPQHAAPSPLFDLHSYVEPSEHVHVCHEAAAGPAVKARSNESASRSRDRLAIGLQSLRVHMPVAHAHVLQPSNQAVQLFRQNSEACGGDGGEGGFGVGVASAVEDRVGTTVAGDGGTVVVVCGAGVVALTAAQCSGGTTPLPSHSSDSAMVPAQSGPPGGFGQSSYVLHVAGSGTPRQTPSQPKQQRGLRTQAPCWGPADHVGW